jgi:hypothetical protein
MLRLRETSNLTFVFSFLKALNHKRKKADILFRMLFMTFQFSKGRSFEHIVKALLLKK